MSDSTVARFAPDPATRSGEELAGFTGARTLRPHIWRSVVLLTIALVFLPLWMIGLTASMLQGLSSVGLQALILPPDIASTLTLLGVGGFVVFLLAWLASLFAPVREPVAEYGTLLPGSAGSGESIFDRIRDTVEAGCPPFTLEPDKLGDFPSLHVTNGTEWAVVMVRPVGADLYVGWSVWRSRSTIALVATTLSDMFDSGAADHPLLLRASSCAALVELLRAAVTPSVSRTISSPTLD